MEISADEAKKYFDKLNSEGILSEEELDNIAGGWSICGNYTDIYCKYCTWTTKWDGHYTEGQPLYGPCPVCGATMIYTGKYHK